MGGSDGKAAACELTMVATATVTGRSRRWRGGDGGSEYVGCGTVATAEAVAATVIVACRAWWRRLGQAA